MEQNLSSTGTSGPNLWSWNQFQVGIFVDQGFNPIVCKRNRLTDPPDKWTTFDLSTLAGDPLGPFANDGHDTPAIATDAEGFIYIAHFTQTPPGANTTPIMIRSTKPLSDPTFALTAWTDIHTQIADPPGFIHAYNYFSPFSDGELLLRHGSRLSPISAWVAAKAYVVNDQVTNGGNIYVCTVTHTSSAAGGAGNQPGVGASWATKWVATGVGNEGPAYSYFYIHELGQTTWTNLGVIVQGDPGTEEGAYMSYPYIDKNDRIHVFFLWNLVHGDITLAVNQDSSYMYSDDRARTWYCYDMANGGLPRLLTTPFTRTSPSGQAAKTGIVFPVPAGNPPGSEEKHAFACTVDANGWPCGTMSKASAPNVGTHIIRWNGNTKTWVDDVSMPLIYGGGQAVNLVNFRGDLWATARLGLYAELRNVDRIQHQTFKYASGLNAQPPGTVSPFLPGRWCWPDPVRLRDTDAFELLTSNNDRPKVFAVASHGAVKAVGAPPPPPPPPTVWDTVNKTGATDVTAAINNIIATTPNGSTITYPPGTYRLDGSQIVNSRSNLTFVGTGVTLIQPYCGNITDGVISGGTNFHSNIATFTPRITGAVLKSAGLAIPANTTVTYVGPHDVTLSAVSTNGPIAGATINPQFTKATARTRSFWEVQFGGGHTWSGFTMLGANPFAGLGDAAYSDNFEAQHGWNLGGTKSPSTPGVAGSGASIHDCTVTDIWGDFVYCSCPGGVGTRVCEDVRIHDCTFNRNGRQGSSPQGVLRYRFDHNNVDNVRRAMFDMEPNGGNQTNRFVEIDNNTFGNHRLLFMAASGGTQFTVHEDINIHDNTSTDDYNAEWHGVPYVDCATTGALPACTYSTVPVNDSLTANANGAFPTIDGVPLVLLTRVLVKNQANAAENGPYRLTVVGDAGTPWKLQRCQDFSSDAKMWATDWQGIGTTFYVLNGTVNANSGFTAKWTDATPVIGTTAITWPKKAGTGLGTGPWALTRKRWTFTNNTTTAPFGNALGAVHEFRYVSDVVETGNTQPLQVRSNPSMVLADLTMSRGTINITGNTLAPVNPVPQFRADAQPVTPGLSYPVGFAIGAGLPDQVGGVYPEIDAEQAHGASFIRFTAGWDSVDPSHNGSFVPTNALQNVVAYCNTIGMDVILTLGQSGTAPWQNNMYSYIPEYSAMCVAAAAYFDGTPGKTLLALELGNEPNHDKWDSTVIGSQKGDRYAQTLIRIFDPAFGNIRSVASCPVIVGGLGGEAASGNGIDSFTFTQNVHGAHTVAGNPYTISLLSHYDGWNSHPYCYYTQPSVDTTGGWDNLKDIMAWFQTTYAGTPPLWVTEFGWPTDEHLSGGVNPSYDADCQDAADALDDIANLLETATWDVRCLAWFGYMDNNKSPDVGHDNYFGIVQYDADFIATPAKPHIATEFQTVATIGLGGPTGG